MVLAFNEDALTWMAPFGLLGLAVFLGLWVHSWWAESREDKKRWGEVSSRLETLGLSVALSPTARRRKGDAPDPVREEVKGFITELSHSCWHPPSRIKSVRWFARGNADGRAVRMAEIEFIRRGKGMVFVENFLLTAAPPHWPDFCLVHKEAARGLVGGGLKRLKHRARIALSREQWMLMTRSRGVDQALRTQSLLSDCAEFPADEQWFVAQGRLCCHWSQPLNGERPERMVRRVEEFVGLMERHMLRLPRAL